MTTPPDPKILRSEVSKSTLDGIVRVLRALWSYNPVTGIVTFLKTINASLGLNTPWVQFDITYSDGSEEGKLNWNSEDGTLEVGMPGGNVTLQIGQEFLVRCRNNTGSTITNGSVVYFSGAQGGKPEISLADASDPVAAHPEGMATEDIAHNDQGFVNIGGYVRAVDTSGIPAGGLAYLSDSTPGAVQATPPLPPAATTVIGHSVISNAESGVFFVDVTFTLDRLSNKLNRGWDGTCDPNPVITLTSNGTTWALTLTGTGTVDLQCIFAGVEYTFETTPAASINLTAGTDTSPQANFIYLTESGGVISLNNSTSAFPIDEPTIRIAECVLQSAASGQTLGAYMVHQHSEHIKSANDGAIVHHSEKLRELGATWFSGVAPANMVVSAPDAYFSVSAGVVHQLHSHDFPALDMQTPTTVYVVNDPTTPFKPITTLDDITQDALGGAINNRHFSLVLWGSMNANGEGQLFINLPIGTYTTAAKAARDAEKYTVFSFPASFKGTGFEIGEYQVEGKDSGTWVQNALIDLRGKVPSASPGGGPGITDHGDLAGLTDNDHPQYLTPAGAMMAYGGTSAPTGWLLCDGASVSRTTYADLFAAIGTAYGTASGSTFNVPDFEGRFLRGTDNGAGRDPDAAGRTAAATGGNTGDSVGSVQADAFQGHWHTLRDGGGNYGAGANHAFNNLTYNADVNDAVRAPISDGVNGTPRTTSETRPINANVNWIIKT